MVMPIEVIPDWELRIARQDAFWECAVLDRPVVTITTPKAIPVCPRPQPRTYTSHRLWWFDVERVVEDALAGVQNTDYWGDALPRVWPNLGPEVFSAFFGQEMEYTESTSWTIPVLKDWAEAGRLAFSKENLYWRKLVAMTDALLEAGRGKFYTGLSDLHPGGDAVAAFRDPMTLNTDLLMYPEEVKALLARITTTYFEVYDFFYKKLSTAGQAITTWAGIASTRKWYVPSNDFSCMVSNEMFEEFFLPGIIEECRFMEASMYHLDGPGALRFLDYLLEIPELNAIQWIYGAGNGRASDWLEVYRRCQAAGKGIQLGCEPNELDVLMERLRPEGVWLSVGGIRSGEEAEAVIRKVAAWR